MFPNSKDIKNYFCGRTKRGFIVKILSLISPKNITVACRKSIFTVATDGSNSHDDRLYLITFIK